MYSISPQRFQPIQGKGLPTTGLPQNWKELIPKFYEQERDKIIELYKEGAESFMIQQRLGNKIRLQWNQERGLTHICLGSNATYSLNDGDLPKFVEHNLRRPHSFMAEAIAKKYISELLKSK